MLQSNKYKKDSRWRSLRVRLAVPVRDTELGASPGAVAEARGGQGSLPGPDLGCRETSALHKGRLKRRCPGKGRCASKGGPVCGHVERVGPGTPETPAGERLKMTERRRTFRREGRRAFPRGLPILSAQKYRVVQ